MAKDVYWFKHDSNAGRSSSLLIIQKIYGHWGKGVYWDVLEVLREQDGYRFENDETSLGLVADLIRADESKFISWYRDCLKYGLLKEDEKHFFSPELSENMREWDKQKANGSQGGRPKKTQNTKLGYEKQKPSGYENQKPEEKRRKEKSILFKDSLLFNKTKFKEAFPALDVDELRHYYEAALDWSESKGEKKVDWAAAVRIWIKKDDKAGISYKKTKSSTHPALNANFF